MLYAPFAQQTTATARLIHVFSLVITMHGYMAPQKLFVDAIQSSYFLPRGQRTTQLSSFAPALLLTSPFDRAVCLAGRRTHWRFKTQSIYCPWRDTFPLLIHLILLARWWSKILSQMVTTSSHTNAVLSLWAFKRLNINQRSSTQQMIIYFVS